MNTTEFLLYFATIFSTGVVENDRANLCDVLAQDSLDIPAQLSRVYNYGLNKNVFYEDFASLLLAQTSFDTAVSNSARQYLWLNCNENNYKLTPNHVYPMRSSKLDADFWTDYCQKIFTDSIGTHFGFSDAQSGTNIVFTNGSEDPWQWASLRMSITNGESSSAGNFDITALISECDSCSHMIEFKSQSSTVLPQILDVQNDVSDLISEWLQQSPAYI